MKEEFRTPPEISFEPGPGARLRQAREAANRGIGEISGALHLDPRVVEALEADSFDRLPPPTFVRGYLKGYARLLGLPPGPILEVYDRRGFGPPPLVPDVTEAPQAHTSDLAVRLVTYGIAAALVVLVVLWWRGQDFQGFDSLDAVRDLIGWPPASMPASPDGGEEHGGSTAAGASPGAREGAGPAGGTESPPESSSAGDSIGGGMITDESPPSADGAADEGMASDGSPPDDDSPSGDAPAGVLAAAGPPSPSDEDTVAGATVPTEPPPPPTPADTVAGVVATTGPPPTGAGAAPGATATTGSLPPPSVGGRVAAAGAVAAAVGTPAPGAAAVPGAGSGIPDRGETPAPEETDDGLLVTPSGPSVPVTGSSLLVVEFTNESWVEIYDRHGATLFFDLVPPDRVLRVTGAPPFDVLFGNSRDVRVTFDGEPFDYAQYVDSGVAQFSLGAAPEGEPDAISGTVPPPGALPPPDEHP